MACKICLKKKLKEENCFKEYPFIWQHSQLGKLFPLGYLFIEYLHWDETVLDDTK